MGICQNYIEIDLTGKHIHTRSLTDAPEASISNDILTVSFDGSGLYVRDKVKLSTGETSRQNLFHINWGWNGQSDGYYSQGVFDATKCISTENGVDENPGTQTYRYTWNYRTITYSL